MHPGGETIEVGFAYIRASVAGASRERTVALSYKQWAGNAICIYTESSFESSNYLDNLA